MHDIVNDECRHAMSLMDADSVDAIVCDPPYALGFLGSEWDTFGSPAGREPTEVRRAKSATYAQTHDGAPRYGNSHGHAPRRSENVAFQEAMTPVFEEALRVAKPGAYLLAFGSPRTFHRLACAIEDAGWIPRDTVMWAYGQGYPKGLNVSKAIDKQRRDDPRPICRFLRDAIDRSEHTTASIAEHFGFNRRMVEHWAAKDTDSQPSVPTAEQWCELKAMLSFGDDMDEEVARLNSRKGEYGDAYRSAEIVGSYDGQTPGLVGHRFSATDNLIRRANSDEAREWGGWFSQIKPAWEPVLMAQKPLDGTIAHNVLTHGCGALNIDACRVPVEPHDASRDGERSATKSYRDNGVTDWESVPGPRGGDPKGRFPANLVHDGSDEVLALFPDSKGQLAKVSEGTPMGDAHCYGKYGPMGEFPTRGDSGSAARFFYCAKASKDDRNLGGVENVHVSVKPNALMRWLVRLVCRKGGLVLDPFMGSGSTGVACIDEGMDFIGIEASREYCEIAEARMKGAVERNAQMALF